MSKKSMNVLVVGATGGSGRATVQELLKAGHTVTAFSRHADRLAELSDRLITINGDATNPREIEGAVRGQDAVIVTLGISENPIRVRLFGSAKTPGDVRSRGTEQVIAAMRNQGVSRLVVMSTFGVGETRDALIWRERALFKLFLKPQIADTEVQEHAIQRFADQSGLTVVAWFEDSGVSGGLDLEQRSGLRKAIEALSEQSAGLLLVWKRDRLARDLMTAVMVDRMTEMAGARVYTTDGDNGDDENAVLLRGIKDLLAQHERLLIRSRTKAALALKKARGERVGTVPYGYQVAVDGIHLEPRPEEQRVIELVKELREAGYTQRRIAVEIAARGIRSRNGTKLGLYQVQRILAKQQDIGRTEQCTLRT